ncbi:MAG: translation initiation factor IF-3 [Clostridia bacterium]|nr:translation initiation factor IF-3 [Clostridia bacterium]
MFKELLTNDQIRFKEVRLLDENGDQVGIVPLFQAKKIAEDKVLDIVLLNSKVNPPVCKIMDYGKFKFDSLKREKELRKNQKVVELKEIQLTMTIDKHDMETKAKHANNFLQNGDKLKVVLRMKGRQRVYANQALEVMHNFYAMVEENGTLDRQPEITGKNVFMIVVPKKK